MDAEEVPARRRTPPVKVWANPVERPTLAATAASVGLSASAYLRRLGLGYQPRTIVDTLEAQKLLKAAADAGRIGGLLKMWLTDDQRLAAFAPADMRPMIHEALRRINETHQEIRAIAGAVLKVPDR